jgi:hypothetical protein
MNLEDDLKRALRRESPAPGFASRVMQRIERDASPKPRRYWWRAVAASLTLTALIGAASRQDHQRRLREIREGELAKEQVLVALRIAGEKVRYAQNEVRTIGSND